MVSVDLIKQSVFPSIRCAGAVKDSMDIMTKKAFLAVLKTDRDCDVTYPMITKTCPIKDPLGGFGGTIEELSEVVADLIASSILALLFVVCLRFSGLRLFEYILTVD